MSIGLSIAKAFAAPKKKLLAPGTYESVVTSVAYAAAYVEGKAIELHYELTAADGSVHPYSEVFFNELTNHRSAKFFEYLRSLGIPLDELEAFVGTKEKLVIKKSTSGRFMTIESREPISDSDADVC